MNENSIGDWKTMVDNPANGASLGRIDQYELKRELGGGGFGCVYLARDTVAGIEVAVKGFRRLFASIRKSLRTSAGTSRSYRACTIPTSPPR